MWVVVASFGFSGGFWLVSGFFGFAIGFCGLVFALGFVEDWALGFGLLGFVVLMTVLGGLVSKFSGCVWVGACLRCGLGLALLGC